MMGMTNPLESASPFLPKDPNSDPAPHPLFQMAESSPLSSPLVASGSPRIHSFSARPSLSSP